MEGSDDSYKYQFPNVVSPFQLITTVLKPAFVFVFVLLLCFVFNRRASVAPSRLKWHTLLASASCEFSFWQQYSDGLEPLRGLPLFF